jgi:prepilin-type N-terminal cleavage/methylation domain-containing protein
VLASKFPGIRVIEGTCNGALLLGGRCTLNAKKNGFTLVELMVVVVIIGILASLAIPRFLAVTARSKATEFRMIFKQLYNLENVYQHENDHYTGVFAELGMDEIPPGARFLTPRMQA